MVKVKLYAVRESVLVPFAKSDLVLALAWIAFRSEFVIDDA